MRVHQWAAGCCDLPASDWIHLQPLRCYIYPGRDCPGCATRCSRTGERLTTDDE